MEKNKDYYKEQIIEMIRGIEKLNMLEYFETFIRLYIEKWG